MHKFKVSLLYKPTEVVNFIANRLEGIHQFVFMTEVILTYSVCYMNYEKLR